MTAYVYYNNGRIGTVPNVTNITRLKLDMENGFYRDIHNSSGHYQLNAVGGVTVSIDGPASIPTIGGDITLTYVTGAAADATGVNGAATMKTYHHFSDDVLHVAPRPLMYPKEIFVFEVSDVGAPAGPPGFFVYADEILGILPGPPPSL